MLGAAVVAGGAVITRAIIRGVLEYARIHADSRTGGAELSGEVAQLRDQVEELRHQLIETQERLDFTERLLTQGRHEPREVG